MMRLMRHVLVVGMLAVSASSATANDSIAELGAGGLVLGRSDVISIESETLYLSLDEVRVDYVFRNNSDADVETIVAFPMPDIALDPYGDMSIPVRADNFLGFTVEVDGASITPALQQRAVVAGGVDVTDRITDAGLPLAPFVGDAYALDVSGLPETTVDALARLGAIAVWEDGQGGREVHPVWTLQSSYYWTMVFPANADVVVRHRYAPATGAAAGVFFLDVDEGSNVFRAYEERFCMDAPFVNAVKREQKRAAAEGGFGYTEATLSYVLTTGANWAGSIKRFRLIVDKGSTKNFVSFCGTGVNKTGPTTFELVYDDFWPEQDLDVLFAVAHDP